MRIDLIYFGLNMKINIFKEPCLFLMHKENNETGTNASRNDALTVPYKLNYVCQDSSPIPGTKLRELWSSA